MPEREVDITEGHQDVGKKAMYLQHVKLDSVSGLGFQCWFRRLLLSYQRLDAPQWYPPPSLSSLTCCTTRNLPDDAIAKMVRATADKPNDRQKIISPSAGKAEVIFDDDFKVVFFCLERFFLMFPAMLQSLHCQAVLTTRNRWQRLEGRCCHESGVQGRWLGYPWVYRRRKLSKKCLLLWREYFYHYTTKASPARMGCEGPGAIVLSHPEAGGPVRDQGNPSQFQSIALQAA